MKASYSTKCPHTKYNLGELKNLLVKHVFNRVIKKNKEWNQGVCIKVFFKYKRYVYIIHDTAAQHNYSEEKSEQRKTGSWMNNGNLKKAAQKSI